MTLHTSKSDMIVSTLVDVYTVIVTGWDNWSYKCHFLMLKILVQIFGFYRYLCICLCLHKNWKTTDQKLMVMNDDEIAYFTVCWKTRKLL